MAPASSAWVCIVAQSPISAPVCDCADLRALALRPGLHQHDRLAGRAGAAAGGEEFGRPADLLAVDRDHAGGAVLGQELDEIGALEAGLVAGRDHVAERQAEPIGGALEMAEQAAALADEGDAALDAALCLAREQHVQPHAIDVVGDAEAIGPHDRKSGRPRRGGDGVLRCLIADLGEAGREDHRRADLAARAGLDRLAHARGRQREHGEVDALAATRRRS